MSDEDFVVDLRDYKDRQGMLVPDGRYTAQITDVELTTAQTGNKMIVLYLKVVGGPEDGATLVDRLTQTANALFRTVNFMRAIGLPTPNKRLKMSKKMLVGRIVDVDVEEGEPYMGNTRSEIRGYLKAVKANGAKSSKVAEEDEDEELETESQEELEGLDEFAAAEPADDVEEDAGEDEEEEEEPARPVKKATAKKATAKKTARKKPEPEEDDVEELDVEEIEV